MTEFRGADAESWSGKMFGKENIGLEDISYAYFREFIEHKGLVLHNQIMKEFLASFPHFGPGEWFINADVNQQNIAKHFNRYVESDYAENHIDYYRDFFERILRPRLEELRLEQVGARMAKLYATPKTIGGGSQAGEYIKVDGKWVEVREDRNQ